MRVMSNTHEALKLKYVKYGSTAGLAVGQGNETSYVAALHNERNLISTFNISCIQGFTAIDIPAVSYGTLSALAIMTVIQPSGQ